MTKTKKKTNATKKVRNVFCYFLRQQVANGDGLNFAKIEYEGSDWEGCYDWIAIKWLN